jgi:hypothetical protein
MCFIFFGVTANQPGRVRGVFTPPRPAGKDLDSPEKR